MTSFQSSVVQQRLQEKSCANAVQGFRLVDENQDSHIDQGFYTEQ